jgi:hypothetical protein
MMDVYVVIWCCHKSLYIDWHNVAFICVYFKFGLIFRSKETAKMTGTGGDQEAKYSWWTLNTGNILEDNHAMNY